MNAPRALRRARLVTATVLLCTVAFTAATAVTAGYTAATTNPGASLAVGTVAVTHSSATGALGITGGALGASDTRCATVTSTGTLASEVRHYATTTGDLAPYLDVRVTKGTTGAVPGSCAGFVPDPVDHRGAGPGVVFEGPLTGLGTGWDDGTPDPAGPGAVEVWTAGESHAYEITVTIRDDPAARGRAGTASLTWEAQST